MTLIQTGIWLIVAVLFFVSARYFFVPLLLKKYEHVSVMGVSWGVSILFALSLVLEQGLSSAFGLPILPPSYLFLLVLIGVGLCTMPILYKRPFWLQFGLLGLICFAGTFALPETLYGISNPIGVMVIRVVLAVAWAFFMMLYTEFDRVPIKGFVVNIVACLLFLLMSSKVFGLLPEACFSFWVMMLMLLLVVWFVYRKFVVLSLGFPLVFIMTFISGFLWIQLSLMPQGVFVLIMMAYPIFEALRTIPANIYRHRFVFPIGEMFLTERALSLQISPKFVLKRVFYIMLLTGIMGIFGMFGSVRYLGVTLLFAILVLYQMYLSLSRVQSKVTLKSLKKDATMGVKELWREVKNVASKRGQPLQAEMSKKKEEVPSVNCSKQD